MGSRLHPFVVTNTPNTSSPLDHSAAVELADTNKGFLPNRLTTTQRDEIISPANGLLIYNTSLSAYQFYDGVQWTGLGGGSDSGTTKIASHAISSPVSHLDITLPVGYDRFHLEVFGIQFTGTDSLAWLFSTNGGLTFIADFTNFDTYVYNIIHNQKFLIPDSTAPTAQLNTDALISIAASQDDNLKYSAKASIDIIPGSATEFVQCSAFGTAVGTQIGNVYYEVIEGWASLYGAATVTPTAARATTIRLQPYGDGTVTPPSTATFSKGGYILLGSKI